MKTEKAKKTKTTVIKKGTHSMMLLPPPKDKCQICAGDHLPEEPHNAQSLFYQIKFNMENSRGANWIDATAHCTPELKAMWREELIKMGVDFDGGGVNPKKAASK